MSKQRSSHLYLLLLLVLPSCFSEAPHTELVSLPDLQGHDYFGRLPACPQHLDLTINDGSLPTDRYVDIRILTGSIYDPNLSPGARFFGDRVPYQPQMQNHEEWPNVGELFAESDEFSYEVLVDGDYFKGPYNVRLSVRPFLFVNAVHGDDTNSGVGRGEMAALKTLTHAIELAPPHSTIQVLPGIYDEANGEQFPIVINSPITIVGDSLFRGGIDFEEGVGAVTRISGAGEYFMAEYEESIQAAVVALGEGVVINGLGIGNGPLGPESIDGLGVGLLLMGRGHRVLNSNCANNFIGITCAFAEQCLIADCRLTGGYAGAYGADSLGENRIRRSEIVGNDFGLSMLKVNEFDLGNQGDPGRNVIADNYLGVYVEGEMTSPQDAFGNTWNAVPLIPLAKLDSPNGEPHDALQEQLGMIDSRGGIERQ
ncbi:MAG: hypothetical protein CL933_10500 [Deltaproteobacteria bacterium]|nr:hypothetical protein [Deltaproteobacteria bacterium]